MHGILDPNNANTSNENPKIHEKRGLLSQKNEEMREIYENLKRTVSFGKVTNKTHRNPE